MSTNALARFRQRQAARDAERRKAMRERGRPMQTNHPLRSTTKLTRDKRWVGERTRRYWAKRYAEMCA